MLVYYLNMGSDRFLSTIKLCSCGTKIQHSINHQYLQLYDDIIMRTVIAPISASSIPSINQSDDECQEIQDKFPSSNHGEKFPVEITAKIPDDISLTLKIPRENPW